MKIGIYIPGLGQSFVDESVEKYAERLKNEFNFYANGTEYEIKTEKINYSRNQSSKVLSICKKNEQSKVLYKLYDFKYNKILTEKFDKSSLIRKSLSLLYLVIKKFPVIIKTLFSPKIHKQPRQTLYLFSIFLVIASALLLLLPATFEVVSPLKIEEGILFLKNTFYDIDIPFVSQSCIETISQILSSIIVSVIALILLLVPNAESLITNLATEFTCANNYIQYGARRQLLQGNLELLIEYISENEKDCKIHFHTYSFGSILAIDYIYPYGNKVAKNAYSYCEAIITIGTPFEFIKSYYPNFYQNRKTELGDKLQWLNIYSISDALASNFRNDSKIGEAHFGIEKNSSKPTNINYEVAHINKNSIIDFINLYSLKVHGMYWDNNTDGQSCLRLVFDEMNKKNLI